MQPFQTCSLIKSGIGFQRPTLDDAPNTDAVADDKPLNSELEHNSTVDVIDSDDEPLTQILQGQHFGVIPYESIDGPQKNRRLKMSSS